MMYRQILTLRVQVCLVRIWITGVINKVNLDKISSYKCNWIFVFFDENSFVVRKITQFNFFLFTRQLGCPHCTYFRITNILLIHSNNKLAGRRSFCRSNSNNHWQAFKCALCTKYLPVCLNLTSLYKII